MVDTLSVVYQYHTLSNGMRLVFRRSNSLVAYSGVYINVGSRDEQPAEEGIAHFIEHSLFKGTDHRRAYHIQNRIDGVGGELNAFTTKEETCVYATSMGEHLPRCLELFADVLFHSTFPDRELEKEKDVIIEEINSYQDSPSELIFDEFEELIFAGHPLAHNILGSKKNVRRFKTDDVRQFVNNRYSTDRMVITVVADIDFQRLIHLCERYFGNYERREVPNTRAIKPVLQQFNTTRHRRTHQAHLLMGCPAPSIYEDDKVAFSLLNNILGGPAMNSRLNVGIRERYGFCYTIESQYVPFSDAGLFYVYVGLENDAINHVHQLIDKEIARLINHPLTDQQLHTAQKQFVAQQVIGNDTGLSEMQSIGKAYLSYGRVDTIGEMSRDITQVTTTDLQRVAERYLRPESFSTLCYV